MVRTLAFCKSRADYQVLATRRKTHTAKSASGGPHQRGSKPGFVGWWALVGFGEVLRALVGFCGLYRFLWVLSGFIGFIRFWWVVSGLIGFCAAIFFREFHAGG